MGFDSSPSVVWFDPQKGEENFARLCQFLMTICGDILRVVLSHHIKPGDLRSKLDINLSKLHKITNTQEKDLLYPPHSSTTSSPPIRSRDLDLSLLYKILRNICNISKHRAGWGNAPVSGDYCVSACIERIRLLRNSISGHSTNGTIDDVEFEDYWRELKRSVMEIENEVIGSDKYERGIDHLHDCDLNPTKAKEYVDQIRRIRERINMVESTCIEIKEDMDAKRAQLDNVEKSVSDMKGEIVEFLTAAKNEILSEVKEIKVQQKIKESNMTNTDRTPSAKFKDKQITRTKTIKFENMLFLIDMGPTFNSKIWLAIQVTEINKSLYLLNDRNVIEKVDIPDQYIPHLAGITTNEKGEAVFTSCQSVMAATEDGTIYKLFEIPVTIPFIPINSRLCFLHSGNYIILARRFPNLALFIHEFSRDGFLLREVKTGIDLEDSSCHIRQNHNGDIVITCNKCLIILDDDFRLKHKIPLARRAVVVPCMNSRSDLLHGHGQTIDLLRSSGEFVKTLYTAQKEKEIKHVACSVDGTAWILYYSCDVEILKLEI